jgi:GxxExxY protein
MVANSTLMNMAYTIMKKLGGGHSESVYHNAMLTLLMKRQIPCMTEVLVPYFMEGICVGNGKIDILLNSHVIEIKNNVKNSQGIEEAEMQLKKYMRSINAQGASPRSGMLIMFNTPNEGPLDKRVSFLNLSHQQAISEKTTKYKIKTPLMITRALPRLLKGVFCNSNSEMENNKKSLTRKNAEKNSVSGRINNKKKKRFSVMKGTH